MIFNKTIARHFIWILYIFFLTPVFGQKTYKVNSIESNKEELTHDLFQYSQFKDGEVRFKDGVITPARFNYNRLFGQMLFINDRGDTLALAHPENFENIVVGDDTFYYYNKNYLLIVTHQPRVNLARVQTIKYIGKEKKGAYGTYSSIISAESNQSYTDQTVTQKLSLDENAVYINNSQYYLGDKYHNFFPATKKGFLNFFSQKENELRRFVIANNTKFNDQMDLEKLLNYLNSL